MISKANLVVVVGAAFGDEGKAKIVDTLASNFDYVVRFQGGDNAGHSVYLSNGNKFVFQLIPTGILRTKAVIAHGVVVNPEKFLNEADEIKKIVPLENRLFISNQAHIIFDWAIALDKLIEEIKSDSKVGTTGKGIGPTYALKSFRFNLRAEDLLNESKLRQYTNYVLKFVNPLFKEYSYPLFDLEETVRKYLDLGQKIKPYLTNTIKLLQNALNNNQKILLEGSQGLLLDLDMGSYPFVTSSSIVGSTTAGTGLPPTAFKEGLLGVIKCYFSRVGCGEFPTEMEDTATAEKIREIAQEYGSVTGRPRRIGWLDLVCLKYCFAFSGIKSIALTLVDVFNGFPEVKVCVDYLDEKGNSVGWEERNNSIKPVYKTFKGWSEDFSKVKSYSDFSVEFKTFLEFVSNFLNCKICMISFGPMSKHTLLL